MAARPRGPASPTRAAKTFPTPSGPHASFHSLLGEFFHALGRAGIDRFGEELTRYQQQVLRDILDGPDEANLAEMHDWWNYDAPALWKRGERYGRPDMPRILVLIDITSKGNLAVTWQPETKPTDWERHTSFLAAPFQRPPNELLFIRDFRILQPKVTEYHHQFDATVDQHLLALCHALNTHLIKRLQAHFNVRPVTELVLDWKERPRDVWSKDYSVVGWRIENVAERERRAAVAELDGALKAIGYDAPSFIAMLEEIRPGLTLTETRDPNILQKLRRGLAGHGVSLTPKPLGRLIELIRELEPLALRPIVPRG